MITNKIKSLLSLKGYSFADYARKLNIFPQTLNNKAKKNAYKIYDLIELGNLTNTRLAFVDKNNNPIIIFNSEDIEK
ncbi:hypothetical protein [[Clostridium] innocuum]|uniref:hypothetical protein n=1 Tax=Clostridium innocuum TaxID=1522 RepID=UPI001C21EAFB|nr:hypothetical protein [[Clostridium] innocuum]MBU9106750.1 hypothetical protein [[Clostridium] innocuum]MBV4170982.1 hypothetical protein [[Clostridium] innocuum]MCQ4709700.1 hypothetical protein [[Clostridium] innocuum]BDF00748.1 hypothetical protein CE91St51_27850 [[Clostridium] innocuum]